MVDEIDMRPVGAPERIGQGTVVEQSRAAAEVIAAVQVARLCPRDIDRARVEMRRACADFALASRAAYRYTRGGSAVTGPTVRLARELVRVFGNFQCGIDELRRDDEFGQSEMKAWAWDVETNSRLSTTFIVPHANYYTGDRLSSLRDVYENNTNQAARRMREMILGLLPSWFVEEAVAACAATKARGDGKPIAERQDSAEKAFSALGVDRGRIERAVGRTKDRWDGEILADLLTTLYSIKGGELTVDEAFPAVDLDVADLAPPPPPPCSPGAWDAINRRFADLGVTGRGQAMRRRQVMGSVLDREVGGQDDLSAPDAVRILEALAGDAGGSLVAKVLGRPDGGGDDGPDDGGDDGGGGDGAAGPPPADDVEAQVLAADPTLDPGFGEDR